MPSASSPASSRARVVLLLEVRVGVAEGRLVTYIGELTVGVGSWTGQSGSGQGSKPAGLIN